VTTANDGSWEGGPQLEEVSAQTLARVPVVAGWIVEGRSRREITTCAGEEWGIRQRQTDRLIALARAELVANWQVQREELTAVLMERADAVYRIAMAQNNAGAAVSVLMAQAKLARL
jgi:hypothetical protein